MIPSERASFEAFFFLSFLGVSSLTSKYFRCADVVQVPRCEMAELAEYCWMAERVEDLELRGTKYQRTLRVVIATRCDQFARSVNT